MSSLTDYAANVGAGPSVSCMICNLPDDVREQIEANFRLPHRHPDRRPVWLVTAWLRSEGHRVSATTLPNHRARGHHR